MRLAIALLLLVGFAAVAHAEWPSWYKKPKSTPVYPEILVSADWLRKHSGDRGVTVVDARPAEAFAAAHIAGALSFDAGACDPDPGRLGSRLGAAGIPSRGTVVCYGDSRDGAAPGRLLWLLELAGHRKVRVLNGGLEAWAAVGGRVEKGTRTPAAARFDLAPDTARIAGFEYVMKTFGVKGHTVMEWRSEAAWRTGHIPHSLPFPLAQLVGPEGLLLDGPKMRPIFQVYGPRKNEYVKLDDEFITCGEVPPGGAPVHPYLAARVAGIERVRCYPGGFQDWRAHPEAPVVRIAEVREVWERLKRSLWDRLRRKPPRNVVLLDLREAGDYRAGHIPGAVLLPSHKFEKEADTVLAEHWPRADRARTPFIVYCYGPRCTRSRAVTTLAARRGWRDLWWFKDGMDGWRIAGLEVERGL
jgi:thiosulfate/3-mercaptopyruvate sulfurtransferase